MKRFGAFLLVLMLVLLVACGTSPRNDGASGTERKPLPPSEMEVEEKDFIYKLYTEKDVYEENHRVAIVAELTYVGEQDTLEITHAETPFLFGLHEQTRNLSFGSLVREIAGTTTLKKGETLTKRYDVTDSFVLGEDKKGISFLETIQEKGFPAGEYVIKGQADFFVTEKEEQYSIKGEIGFRVEK